MRLSTGGAETLMHSIQPHGIDPIGMVPLTPKQRSLPKSHAQLTEMLPNSCELGVIFAVFNSILYKFHQQIGLSPGAKAATAEVPL